MSNGPISPCIADFVLEILEESVLSKWQYDIPFFFRYVDDILTAVPNNEINNFQKLFNSYDTNIQFTVEEEISNKISFLDILLIKQINGVLTTDWYHKPTWSGRNLN